MRLNFLLAAALVSTVPGAALAQQAGSSVGPQYDTTRVYVAPADFARFIDSVVATFGGTSSCCPSGLPGTSPGRSAARRR